MDPKDLAQCKSILRALVREKYSWPFLEPVDPVALELPDYFEIIKKPMDLGTVRNRLDKKLYNSVSEFKVDVDLTFQNALTYNQPGSDIVTMTKSLQDIFEKKYAATKFVNTSAPSVNTGEKHARRASDTKLSGTASGSKKRTKEDDQKVSAKRQNRVVKEMTFEEKKELGKKINLLSPPHLAKVVEIIKNALAADEEWENQDDIEVDMNDLSPETLMALDDFVNSNLDPNAYVEGEEAEESYAKTPKKATAS